MLYVMQVFTHVVRDGFRKQHAKRAVEFIHRTDRFNAFAILGYTGAIAKASASGIPSSRVYLAQPVSHSHPCQAITFLRESMEQCYTVASKLDFSADPNALA